MTDKEIIEPEDVKYRDVKVMHIPKVDGTLSNTAIGLEGDLAGCVLIRGGGKPDCDMKMLNRIITGDENISYETVMKK